MGRVLATVDVLCLLMPTSPTDEAMPNRISSQRRSDVLGRLQQTSDRHDAAQETETNRLNVADVDKQLLADLRTETEALRNAAAELRGVVEEAKRVIEELTKAAKKP